MQQLDILADFGTKSYIVGSTNSLLLQQRDRYSDILINLDDSTINITSTSLRSALQLSVPDRRWIDFITQEVNDTWDESNPGRPKTMGYVGSEEFIRLQFEEYLLSLISSVKYHSFLEKTANNPKGMLRHIDGDPSTDFNPEFLDYWTRTENYRLWNSNTEMNLFDVVEPKHPCAGGLTIDDVQRRIAQQVQDLHLDERFAQGREALGRNLAVGREKASSVLNKLYAEMETLRQSQRQKAEEAKAEEARLLQARREVHHERNGSSFSAVDLAKAQQAMQSVGVKAGAYMSSWAVWAGEKRKAAAWPRSPSISSVGGWGLVGAKRGNRSTMSSATSDASSEKELQMSGMPTPRMSISSSMTGMSDSEKISRPLTQTSFGESVLEGAPSEVPSDPISPSKSRRLSGEGATAVPSGLGIIDNVVASIPERNGDVTRDPPPPPPPTVKGAEKPPVETTVSVVVPAGDAAADDDNDEGPPLSVKEDEPQEVLPSPPPGPVGSKVMLRP